MPHKVFMHEGWSTQREHKSHYWEEFRSTALTGLIKKHSDFAYTLNSMWRLDKVLSSEAKDLAISSGFLLPFF